MIFEIPESALEVLAKDIGKIFSTTTVRVVGDPNMKVSSVGIVPGAYGWLEQVKMLQEPEVEVLIVGESREWETVEYVRDASEMGMKKALIIMGHADSEEPGMGYFQEWLQPLVGDIPVEFIPARNPLWTPR